MIARPTAYRIAEFYPDHIAITAVFNSYEQKYAGVVVEFSEGVYGDTLHTGEAKYGSEEEAIWYTNEQVNSVMGIIKVESN